VKRSRIVLLLLLAIGSAALLTFVFRSSRDTRIEPLIGWYFGGNNVRYAAIEREVVETELASYGVELIPALREELHRGSIWRTKIVSWLETSLPSSLARQIGQKRSEAERRRQYAALCLGRLGTNATSAIPELKSLAATGGGPLGLTAEVALAMVARQDSIIQSNALASLTSGSQPRRHLFTIYADELWPGRLDLFSRLLNDADDSVRSRALQLIGNQGPSASNSIPLMVSMLKDPSAIVRPRAALALGQVAPALAETAVACMIEKRRTNFMWTGDYAYVLYQAVGPAAKAAIPSLEADLADGNLAVFHGDAAAALWRITGKMSPQIIAGLNTGLRIGVQRTQLRCLRAIKEIGPAAAGTIPELTRMTSHPRLLLRKLATEALERVRD
jgi:hypothetical protein